MSALPANWAFTAPMTLPISPGPLAPSSATMAATAAVTSSALMRWGRYTCSTAISACSIAAKSWRPALSKALMLSLRCLMSLSMMATMAASSSSMRSSTSFCFIAACSRRMVDRRALSLARMAVFMSSVIWALRLITIVLGKAAIVPILCALFWQKSVQLAARGGLQSRFCGLAQRRAEVLQGVGAHGSVLPVQGHVQPAFRINADHAARLQGGLHQRLRCQAPAQAQRCGIDKTGGRGQVMHGRCQPGTGDAAHKAPLQGIFAVENNNGCPRQRGRIHPGMKVACGKLRRGNGLVAHGTQRLHRAALHRHAVGGDHAQH